MRILLIMISIVAEETTLHKVQWALNTTTTALLC